MNISPKQYAQILNELTSESADQAELDESIEKIAAFIKDNQDQAKIGKIVREFEALLWAESGHLPVEIESPGKLSEALVEKIMAAVSARENIAKEKIELSSKENPELVGGIKVKIRNEEIDGTVQSKLARLKLSLT